MAATVSDFAADRLAAVQNFAHTMIVVDDEADKEGVSVEVVPAEVHEPGRRAATVEPERTDHGHSIMVSHPLNSRIVVDQAMDLGLVCSIVQPEKRDRVVKKVSKAAERADILSLDWQMHGDHGDIAKSIIKRIIQTDDKKGGRLRLIAIYTGVRDRNEIYESVLKSLPKATKKKYKIRSNGESIISNHGLRIVWLFKGDGTRLTGDLEKFQVKEEKLPSRLQAEFAELSEGLLSNVALATIASVRDATHHVLGKFKGSMDGPYFHHRAFLENPADAEDYAVSIVLSELKSAVNKQDVATRGASENAIKNRLKHLSNGNHKFKLNYSNDKRKDPDFELTVEEVISIIVGGLRNAKINGLPGEKKVRPSLSSIFVDSYKACRHNMMAFASLTGVRVHPGSQLYGRAPQLVLGTIVKTPDNKYLICLQASCDTVRVKAGMGFYFVPMSEEKDKPDHVVPILKNGDEGNYLGLVIDDKAYTKSRSLTFPPNAGNGVQTVRASKSRGIRGYYFTDTKGEKFEWIANLKQRRAMRSAQWISQDMGRIGFDEFEPFRPNSKPNN